MLRHLVWSILDPILLKVSSRLDHLDLLYPRDHSQKWNGSAEFDATVRFNAGAVIANAGQPADLKIGSFSLIFGGLRVVAPGGRLKIGHHCFVGEGSNIWAQTNVEIGNYVLLSHLVDVHDSDSHSLRAEVRRRDPINLFEKNQPIDWNEVASEPVRIEDDVWIGFKASILKGVTIGRGAVVAACSVVTKDVPPFTIVAGNPAQPVKTITAADNVEYSCLSHS